MTVLDQFRLDDRVAMVTGAAGGIGGAIAEAMAEAGADVAIVDVDEEGLESTAERLETETDAAVEPIGADVGDEAETDRMVAETVEAFGGLDVAFANAGIAELGGSADEFDVAAWDRQIRVNLRGVFLTDRAAAARMRANGGGSIVNTASILGLRGTQFPGLTAYNASKGGVLQVTRQFAAELGRHGVRVNAIAPGFVETALTEESLNADKDAFRSQIPVGRLGQPADVKGVAVYLASDASQYTIGEVHLVDGGMNAV